MKIEVEIFKKTIDEQFVNEEKRYIILDDDGNVIDDAQGYGYKSFEKAKKALWYKFKKGKEKIKNDKKDSEKFWKDNPEAKKEMSDMLDFHFKEIMRGETSKKDIIKKIEEKFKIKIDKKYLKYL